jgi:hypothetical protein
VRSDQRRWWVQFEVEPVRDSVAAILDWALLPIKWDDSWSQYRIGRRNLTFDDLVRRLSEVGYAATRIEVDSGPLSGVVLATAVRLRYPD